MVFLPLILFILNFNKTFSQNNCLQLDGLNDNVLINNSPSLDFSINSSFSIEAWFNKTTSSDGEIFSKMANSPPYRGYELYMTSAGKLSFLFINNWTTNCIWLETTSSFNDGNWHHVALVYKGIANANTVDVYVDGILQTKNITYNSLTGSTNTSNNAGIGARSSTGYLYSGLIDEVRIWNKALCSAEVTGRKNCNLTGTEAGLVAYYNFNQGVAGSNNSTVTTLIDLTANNNIGVLNSFALNGATSNWVTSGSSVTGTCAPVGTGTISVSGNTVVCSGSSTTLTASGAASYTWNPGGFTTPSIIITPTLTTIYTIAGTSTVVGCVAGATATTVVNPLPSVVANISPNPICKGNTTTPNGGGATTYTWSSGLTNGVAFNPTVTTTYSVTGTDVNGCKNTASKTVTVNPTPTITATGSSSLICIGQSATLTANGGTSYIWTSGPTTSVIVVSPTVTTSYGVSGTNSFGCSGIALVTVNVSTCIGVKELNNSESQINLYPNPNNGDFNLRADIDMNLNLINELGQLVQTIELNSFNNREFRVKNLNAGLYFIYGTNEHYTLKQKIVVSK